MDFYSIRSSGRLSRRDEKPWSDLNAIRNLSTGRRPKKCTLFWIVLIVANVVIAAGIGVYLLYPNVISQRQDASDRTESDLHNHSTQNNQTSKHDGSNPVESDPRRQSTQHNPTPDAKVLDSNNVAISNSSRLVQQANDTETLGSIVAVDTGRFVDAESGSALGVVNQPSEDLNGRLVQDTASALAEIAAQPADDNKINILADVSQSIPFESGPAMNESIVVVDNVEISNNGLLQDASFTMHKADIQSDWENQISRSNDKTMLESNFTIDAGGAMTSPFPGSPDYAAQSLEGSLIQDAFSTTLGVTDQTDDDLKEDNSRSDDAATFEDAVAMDNDSSIQLEPPESPDTVAQSTEGRLIQQTLTMPETADQANVDKVDLSAIFRDDHAKDASLIVDTSTPAAPTLDDLANTRAWLTDGDVPTDPTSLPQPFTHNSTMETTANCETRASTKSVQHHTSQHGSVPPVIVTICNQVAAPSGRIDKIQPSAEPEKECTTQYDASTSTQMAARPPPAVNTPTPNHDHVKLYIPSDQVDKCPSSAKPANDYHSQCDASTSSSSRLPVRRPPPPPPSPPGQTRPSIQGHDKLGPSQSPNTHNLPAAPKNHVHVVNFNVCLPDKKKLLPSSTRTGRDCKNNKKRSQKTAKWFQDQAEFCWRQVIEIQEKGLNLDRLIVHVRTIEKLYRLWTPVYWLYTEIIPILELIRINFFRVIHEFHKQLQQVKYSSSIRRLSRLSREETLKRLRKSKKGYLEAEPWYGDFIQARERYYFWGQPDPILPITDIQRHQPMEQACDIISQPMPECQVRSCLLSGDGLDWAFPIR